MNGYPSAYIVVQLGNGFDNAAAAEDTVDALTRELDETMGDLTVIVTWCDDAFRSCAFG